MLRVDLAQESHDFYDIGVTSIMRSSWSAAAAGDQTGSNRVEGLRSQGHLQRSYDFTRIDKLLAPKSVALIGASPDPTRIGGRPIAAMLAAGYQGAIFPVNPSRTSIQGLPCYASVSDLPRAPDAAIVAVPAPLVPAVITELGESGCRVVTVFTAGFSETGTNGVHAEADILEIARKYGISILGPNTLGVYNVGINYYGTFSSSLEQAFPLPGNIGIASQSGAYGAHLSAVARSRNIGASVLITTGNEIDVTVADAIGWMATSDYVDVICAYQEGFKDPGRLIAALAAARQARKPVFMLKAGRSGIGAAAAASHTAALAGDDKIAEVALSELGVIRVHDVDEMLDYAATARLKIYPVGNTLGVVTVSGGAGVIASDEAELLGLPMPPMPSETQAKLKALLSYSTPINPLDCTAQALTDLTLFEQFMRAALDQGGYRSLVCFLTYVAGSPTLSGKIFDVLSKLRTEFPDKLVAVCLLADDATTRAYAAAGFATFADPSRAVRAVAAMGRVGDIFERELRPAPRLPHVDLPPTSPNERVAKQLLADVGISTVMEQVVRSSDEAVQAAEEIGFPVVLKIVSADILHKSEVKGVRLGLADSSSVRIAHDEILRSVRKLAPQAQVDGILVARQLSGGVECLAGVKRDPVFGPMLVFGLGGIFVEHLDDVAIRPCPVDETAAREMIMSIRAAGILTGARGQPAVDLDALAKALSRLSAFAAAAGPGLRSIDINPLLALSEGAFMLDAVIEVEVPASAACDAPAA